MRATEPFWLDGGYDRDSVEACPQHPNHVWWQFRIGDVIEPGRCHDPDEQMVICRFCYVPRCGSTHDKNPCLLPRHHREPHRYPVGDPQLVGGYAAWETHQEQDG